MRYVIMIMIVLLSTAAMAVSYNLPKGSDIEVRGSSDWDTITESTTFVNQNPDPAEPGGYVELRFKVENIGSSSADNVLFEFVPSFPFSLDPGASPVRRLGDVDARQVGENAYVIYYKARVDSDAVQGNNDLRVRYSLDNGLSWRMLDSFKVRIESHNAPLEVVSVSTVPEMAAPGSTADISIAIKNLAKQRLKDITVTLNVVTTLTSTASVTQTELPLTPLGSTNEKMVVKLDPNQVAEVGFKLAVDPDAAVGIYKLPVTITYTDDFGADYSKSVYIGLKVGEEPDVILTLDDSTVHSRDAKGTVTVRFVNKGDTDLKFLYLQIPESNNIEVISSREAYLGNIDSDDYETADFDVFVNDGEGPVVLPVIAEFRDAHNKLYRKHYDLDLQLYTEEDAERYGLKESSSRTGIIIIVVIVFAGLGIYWWRRKRK